MRLLNSICAGFLYLAGCATVPTPADYEPSKLTDGIQCSNYRIDSAGNHVIIDCEGNSMVGHLSLDRRIDPAGDVTTTLAILDKSGAGMEYIDYASLGRCKNPEPSRCEVASNVSLIDEVLIVNRNNSQYFVLNVDQEKTNDYLYLHRIVMQASRQDSPIQPLHKGRTAIVRK